MEMKKIRILVMDDEEAEDIKESLEGFTFENPEAGIETTVGCKIETATQIDEAERKINELKDDKKFYDIIILDMEMESKSEQGLELAEKILKLSSIKIVFTAHSSVENCIKCLKAGAFDYIDKLDVASYEKLKSAMKLGLDKRLKKPFDPFMRWLNKNLAEFTERYSGEHIAVIDEIVVEHDLDSYTLMERVKKNYPFHHPTIATIPRKEDKECLFLQ